MEHVPIIRSIYTAYGDGVRPGARAASAFTGERAEGGTGLYLLGRRLYHPALRRFTGPDPRSPFGGSDANRYAYCGGDPVNRADPTGLTWRDWLASALGRTGATAASPSTGSLATAAIRDAAPVVADVGKASARGLDRDRAGGLMGRLPTTKAAAAIAPGAMARGVGPSTAAPARRTVRHMKGQALIPADRVSSLYGKAVVSPDWQKRNHPARPSSVHWIVDTEVYGKQIGAMIPTLNKALPADRARRNVYIYSGVHGASDGNNWRDGVRRSRPNTFADYDARNAPDYELVVDADVAVENISAITRRDMKRRMRRSGHHVHAYCFSAADDLVMKELQIDDVTVYEL